MTIKLDAGQVFGNLTVIKRAGKDRHGRYLWLCLCKCGRKRKRLGTALKTRAILSCGCLLRAGNRRTHGKVGTRTYRSWKQMKARCRNPKATGFKHWGGRGIDYHHSWETFEQFFADMGECPAGLTIERIDNNGNYEPGNCIWAPYSTQARNKQNTRRITFRGRTQSLKDWTEELGLPHHRTYIRLRRGDSPEVAFQKRAFRAPNKT